MKRTVSMVVLLCVMVALLVGAQPVLGQQGGTAKHPSTTDLGKLPGTDFSEASAINDRGQVVGGSQRIVPGFFPQWKAFLWDKGRMTALGSLAPSLEFASSYALDINNRGQVVGLSDYPVSDGILWPRAFLWEKGRITDLGALPGRGLAGSWAYGINDRGQVAGSSRGRAFLWEDGRMTDLGTLPGRDFSWAYGINNRGQVVGYSYSEDAPEHAFLWEKGRMTDLGTLGGNFSEAIRINDRGQVVGYSMTASGMLHAFLWEDGRMTDLGTLPGGDGSIALSINSRGQVVGYDVRLVLLEHDGQDVPVYVPRAFLWEDDQMTSLTAQSGELYSVASDINNRGQMVGTLATKPLLILRCCNIVARWDWQAVLWGKGSRGPSSTFTSSDRSQSSKGQDTAPPFGIRATFEDSKQQELLLQALYPGPSGLEAPVVRLSTSER